MIKYLQTIFLFLLVMVSFHFFEAQFLSNAVLFYLPFFYISLTIAISVPYFFRYRCGYVLPVQLIVLSMLISIIMAYISWGQSFMQSIVVTVSMMLWIFFFYLLHIKFSVNVLEKIILIYGVIYILIYFFQLYHSPTVIFGGGEEFREERGVTRIIIPGGGIFFLASFIALNKMTTQKRGRWLWISMSIIGIVMPILMATRQIIAGVSIIYLFHFIKNQPLYRKLIILTSLIAFMLYISRSDNTIIKGIIEAQKETSQEDKDYIRIISGTYFLTEFSPANISRVFGNGVPYERSEYGKFVGNLKDIGINMTDVGIIAFYAMFGILAVIAYILIWIKSFSIPLPTEYYYAKYYLWFLLITSLTSATVYHYRYLIATIFALYIYQTIYINQVRWDSDFAA